MAKKIMGLLGAAAFTFGLASGLRAVQFQSSADVQLGGGYSALQGGEGSWAGAGEILFIPMWKLGSSDYIVPAIYATDSGRQEVMDEGNSLPAFFTQSLVLTGEPEWKHDFGQSGWESGVYAMAVHGYDKDYDSEAWGKGFYDYEQYGGGVQLSKKDLDLWGMTSLAVDLSDAHRALPNYHNSAAAFEGFSRDYYVNDLYISKLDVALGLPESLLLDYSITLNNYTDSFQYNPDGTFDNTLRMEKYHDLRLSWSKALGSYWSVSANLEGTYTESNYDNYDFTNNVFMYDYYSNYTYGGGPTLIWIPSGDTKRSTVSLTYRAQYTDYLHRLQMNPDGSDTEGTETDFENTFTLFGRKVIDGPWSVYTTMDMDMVQSNQSSMQGVNFSYEIFDSQLGVEYQY